MNLEPIEPPPGTLGTRYLADNPSMTSRNPVRQLTTHYTSPQALNRIYPRFKPIGHEKRRWQERADCGGLPASVRIWLLL